MEHGRQRGASSLPPPNGRDAQSSARKSGTFLKSPRLPVSRTASYASPIAAIRRSMVPIWILSLRNRCTTAVACS